MGGCTILLEESTFLLASLTCHFEVTVSEKKIPYIEGFVPRINTSPKPTIFTNNTIATLSSKTFNHFCSVINLVPSHMSNSFTANKLFLNLSITYIQIDFVLSPSCVPEKMDINQEDLYKTRNSGIHGVRENCTNESQFIFGTHSHTILLQKDILIAFTLVPALALLYFLWYSPEPYVQTLIRWFDSKMNKRLCHTLELKC